MVLINKCIKIILDVAVCLIDATNEYFITTASSTQESIDGVTDMSAAVQSPNDCRTSPQVPAPNQISADNVLDESSMNSMMAPPESIISEPIIDSSQNIDDGEPEIKKPKIESSQ